LVLFPRANVLRSCATFRRGRTAWRVDGVGGCASGNGTGVLPLKNDRLLRAVRRTQHCRARRGRGQFISKRRNEQHFGTPEQVNARCATYLSIEGLTAPRSWVANGSAALMAGAAGWPCDGPSPTQARRSSCSPLPAAASPNRCDTWDMIAAGKRPGGRNTVLRLTPAFFAISPI
jgi:hypothetical protein